MYWGGWVGRVLIHACKQQSSAFQSLKAPTQTLESDNQLYFGKKSIWIICQVVSIKGKCRSPLSIFSLGTLISSGEMSATLGTFDNGAEECRLVVEIQHNHGDWVHRMSLPNPNASWQTMSFFFLMSKFPEFKWEPPAWWRRESGGKERAQPHSFSAQHGRRPKGRQSVRDASGLAVTKPPP